MKRYTSRPKKKGPAQKAWDELQAKAGANALQWIAYDRFRKTWRGVHYTRMVSIKYWPKIPGAIV